MSTRVNESSSVSSSSEPHDLAARVHALIAHWREVAEAQRNNIASGRNRMLVRGEVFARLQDADALEAALAVAPNHETQEETMSQRQRTREDDIDDAMARLHRRRGELSCPPKHPYRGNIQHDLDLVLGELHRLRAAPPSDEDIEKLIEPEDTAAAALAPTSEKEETTPHD